MTILLQSGPVYIPGVKQRVTVQVSDPEQQRWGFELTARLNSDPESSQAGELNPVDNFTQVICEDFAPRPCSSGVSFIQHTSAGSRIGTRGGAVFEFDWIPPSSNVGPITLYVAGNAANGDGSFTGDHIYTSNIQLDPVIASAPTITSIVSAATSAPGPLASNSWVTIYGSNLSATTRTWKDSDLAAGGMPYSLDGVSVVLFGAPRLAYVGYVSPTQVNFLLPSDLNPGTIQVQLKNPAATSARTPITVQASAPQLLTVDGKYVWGVHAGGGSLGKTTPAAPGETVIFYGTGWGATNPALIPGQLPTEAARLVTPPQVTIGGAAANVVSAAVVPGAGGVYQVSVQIPANAENGDLPVVVQLGGVSSASTLITVQK